jgi:hypothetical protein
MIIIPKKISDNEIEKFFNKKGFSNLVKQKGEELENWIDRRRHKLTHPPRLRHLYMIYQTIILNKRTTVLEFGTGISTLVMARALLENKKKFGPKKPFERCEFPFQLLTVDNQKKFIKISKSRISKTLKKDNNVKFFYSDVRVTMYGGNFATEYEKLPQVNPDFIYLDGPSQWKITKTLNNFTTSQADMMPMSCDIAKFENFLTPGTIIVSDGRTANCMFLKNNFKRNWLFKIDRESDHCYFYLQDDYLGLHNKKQLEFYKKP